MKNVKMDVQDNILTITVDLSEDHGKSASGKSIIIASTEGNAALEGKYDAVKVGLNVYKRVRD